MFRNEKLSQATEEQDFTAKIIKNKVNKLKQGKIDHNAQYTEDEQTAPKNYDEVPDEEGEDTAIKEYLAAKQAEVDAAPSPVPSDDEEEPEKPKKPKKEKKPKEPRADGEEGSEDEEESEEED